MRSDFIVRIQMALRFILGCSILFKILVGVVKGYLDEHKSLCLIKIVFHPYINIIVTYVTENLAFMVLHKNSLQIENIKVHICHHSKRGLSCETKMSNIYENIYLHELFTA